MASKIPDNVANPSIYKKAKAKAKAKFEVYPSAYANGFMVQEYQRMGGEYKGANKDWFGSENWVDISAPKEGGGYEKCGRQSADDSGRGYPKCVPSAKAAKMSKKEVASAVNRKRAKKQGVGGKPTNVSTFAAEGGSIMKMKTKGYAKGGAGNAMPKPVQKKYGGSMMSKGRATGGVMMPKGKATGGAMKSKAKSSSVRAPSSKNSGLYGR